jgi:hypothetical protein
MTVMKVSIEDILYGSLYYTLKDTIIDEVEPTSTISDKMDAEEEVASILNTNTLNN